MARIRTVKPDYFTHPEITPLPIPARLLFLSMLTQADDEGRLYDQPRRIGGLAFGEADKVNVPKMLEELATRGRILRYEVDGKPCIQIVHFSDHQVINRPTPSVIPPCPLTEESVSPPGEVTAGSGSGSGSGSVLASRTRSKNGNGQPTEDQTYLIGHILDSRPEHQGSFTFAALTKLNQRHGVEAVTAALRFLRYDDAEGVDNLYGWIEARCRKEVTA